MTIYGTTSTLRINPDMVNDTRVCKETKLAIKNRPKIPGGLNYTKHIQFEKDNEILIHVAKYGFVLKSDDISYYGHSMAWSINKETASKMAEEQAKAEIDKRNDMIEVLK